MGARRSGDWYDSGVDACQWLERIGVTRASRLDVTKLLDVIRRQPVRSFFTAGKAVGTNETMAKPAVPELGMPEKVERLFRLRKRRVDGEMAGESLVALREFAMRLGRTPTAADLLRHDRPPTLPSMGRLQRQFGSVSKAMVAAGLVPNPTGRRPRR